MKFQLSRILLSITILGTFTLVSCQKSLKDVKTPKAPDTLNQSVIEAPAQFGVTFQLPSEVYGMNREVNIYVPNLPDWGKDYFETPLSVLYVIDGGLDQDFFHIAALSQLTLINAERQPMIVVGVRTHSRRHEISPKATDPRYLTHEFEGWGGSHDFRRHLTEEVMPFVESRFDTGRKTVIGESLAGLFIIEMFLESPSSFDDYISVSPSLWWDNRRLSKQASALLDNHEVSDRRLYLTMANEGGTMRLGLDELLEALGPHSETVDVKFVDRANTDTHASIYHHAARDALSWLYGIPAEPYGDAPWYLTLGGEPTAKE